MPLPVKMLFGFGALMALIALFTVVDASKRPELETIAYPSALGDHSFFANEEEFSNKAKLAAFQGKSLVRAQTRVWERDDWRFEPAGQDDSGQWTVYRLSRTNSPVSPELFFLKVAPNRYISAKLES